MCSFPLFASAQIVITEIMYDLAEGSDSGREWIEVTNTGSEPVDFTKWKLFENDTNHGLTATNGETLTPGAYAIIADNPIKFKTDWPSYNGLLFDSAFSLNNTGETLILRCCGKELSDKDSVSYSSEWGASGDGTSLAKSGSFTPSQPNPGQGGVVAPVVPEPEPKPEPEPEPVQKVIEEPKEEPANKRAVVQEELRDEQKTIIAQDTKPKKTTQQSVVVTETEEGPDELEVEEPVAEESESQVAAAQEAASGDWTWWLGALAFTGIGAVATVFFQRARKKEWDIVEE